MKKKFIHVFFLFFMLQGFAFAEIDNQISIIDSFLNEGDKNDFSSAAKVFVLSGLGAKSGINIQMISGVPGPRFEKNRYQDTLLLFPKGASFIVKADYRYKNRGGSAIVKTFQPETGVYVMIGTLLNSKGWTIELEPIPLTQEEVLSLPSEEKWKLRVWETLNSVSLEKKPDVKVWEGVYQKEIEKAVNSFFNEDAFKEIQFVCKLD